MLRLYKIIETYRDPILVDTKYCIWKQIRYRTNFKTHNKVFNYTESQVLRRIRDQVYNQINAEVCLKDWDHVYNMVLKSKVKRMLHKTIKFTNISLYNSNKVLKQIMIQVNRYVRIQASRDIKGQVCNQDFLNQVKRHIIDQVREKNVT